MSVIYLDIDALQLAQSRLNAVLDETRMQVGAQSWRTQTLESTLVGLRGQVLGAMNPAHLWTVWETSGLAGIAAEFSATYGAHAGLLGATNFAVEQLSSAHADVISAYFSAQAELITRPLGRAMNDLSQISGVFHLDNLRTLIENPWHVITLGQDALGALESAVSALEAYVGHLGRVLAREEAVIANVISQAATIQEVPLPATKSPFSQQAQNDLQQGKLSAHDLANGVNTGYSLDGGALPISISRGVDKNGKSVLLVMIAGVNRKKPLQANYFLYAILAGAIGGTQLGALLDPYALEVEADIRAYERQQGLGAGTPIDIAGHSYGGIAAQEIQRDQWLLGFNVAHVFALGSPDLHSGALRYTTLYDAVPLLSPNPLSVGALGLQGIAAATSATPIGSYTSGAYSTVKQWYTGAQVVHGGDDPNPIAWFGGDHVPGYANSPDAKMNVVPFTIDKLSNTDYFGAPLIPPATVIAPTW